MSGPDPAVAAVRRAVRAVLPAGGVVLVACSGGADSLALLAATLFEAGSPKSAPLDVIGAVIDHGLQDGSAAHTAEVCRKIESMGARTVSVAVEVDIADGIEAGARAARYRALAEIATDEGAAMVLLGHTRDDQAETVLLGLVRGSGGRSLAGMPSEFDRDAVRFVRPMLGITRAETEAACRAERIAWWSDPHNADPRFTRARIRHVVLPMLETELGPGVAAALSRTADSLRADVDALDDEAREWQVAHPVLAVEELLVLKPALRTRVLRLSAIQAGVLAGELTNQHIGELDDLVVRWRGQQWVDLPGHIRGRRSEGRVLFDHA